MVWGVTAFALIRLQGFACCRCAASNCCPGLVSSLHPAIIDFNADFRYRLQGVWREAESVAWFANPFKVCKQRSPNLCNFALVSFLDLPERVVCNVSMFRLCEQKKKKKGLRCALKVELAIWQDGTSLRDSCPCNQT
eukprot:1149380-Pelagomonas_calceolata.AAC.1